MGEKIEKNRIRLTFQILLPILCLLWAGFILGNSLRTGQESSAQSSAVVAAIQRVARAIAPNSFVATAVGEDYLVLHNAIRKLAHFVEFAVWGALLCGCYFAYTSSKTRLWLPILGIFVLPICDELLQKFVSGRAGMLADVLIDVSGGIFGFIAVLGVILIIAAIKRRKICRKKV